jgi:hypothetical protein
MLSSTTRGVYEIGQFRRRITRDYGVGRLSWDDLSFITQRLSEIEDRLVEIAATTDQLNQDDRQTAQTG